MYLLRDPTVSILLLPVLTCASFEISSLLLLTLSELTFGDVICGPEARFNTNMAIASFQPDTLENSGYRGETVCPGGQWTEYKFSCGQIWKRHDRESLYLNFYMPLLYSQAHVLSLPGLLQKLTKEKRPFLSRNKTCFL